MGLSQMVGNLSRKVSYAFRTGLVVIAAIVATAAASAGASAQPEKVVELFTSQGCSSCPPADQLAERLVEEEQDVPTVLMPVDYWDYLGWQVYPVSYTHLTLPPNRYVVQRWTVTCSTQKYTRNRCAI